jgi:hypothetical protein
VKVFESSGIERKNVVGSRGVTLTGNGLNKIRGYEGRYSEPKQDS